MPSRRASTVRTWILLIAVASGHPSPSPGQGTPPPPRCDAPEYRRLDFWVGDWEVTVGGKPAGANRVTLEEAGCLVHEHWTGVRGGTGQSFNFYNREDGEWHQVWVSNGGDVLNLAGRYADSTLTYLGETRQPDGTTLRHRLSFRANPDGTVRQLWKTSSDGGSTWATSFDGLYRKRKT